MSEETVTITFDKSELPYVADALRRRFIQVKKGRELVMTASLKVLAKIDE